jgi:1,4-alpha-glucan branching enzyme
MPGDDWQKFANLRAYYGFMWTHPGKKLLFMGGEFAQHDQWDHDHSLDWHLLAHDSHNGIQKLVKDLNHTYRMLPALHQRDCDSEGFEWLVSHNAEQSLFIYLRKGHEGTPPVLVVVNMTPNTYTDYLVGVPQAGFYQEYLNTDSSHYGGSNVGNLGGVQTHVQDCNGQPFALSMTVAPLATMIFQWQSQH